MSVKLALIKGIEFPLRETLSKGVFVDGQTPMLSFAAPLRGSGADLRKVADPLLLDVTTCMKGPEI